MLYLALISKLHKGNGRQPLKMGVLTIKIPTSTSAGYKNDHPSLPITGEITCEMLQHQHEAGGTCTAAAYWRSAACWSQGPPADMLESATRAEDDASATLEAALVSTRTYSSPGAEEAAPAPITLPKNGSLIMAV